MVGNSASPVAAGETASDLRPGADWEYAPAPESPDIVTIRGEYGLFIDGDFAEPLSGEHFSTVNPASEEPLASVAEAGGGGRGPAGAPTGGPQPMAASARAS
jgi:hypothetical protein